MQFFQKKLITQAMKSVMIMGIILNVSANAKVQELDSIITIVNDKAILQSELSKAVQYSANKSVNPTISPNEIYVQTLNDMINRSVQLDILNRQGFSVDETQLNGAMLSIAKKQGFESLSSFQKSLDSQQAGTYQALRERVRDDMGIQALQQQHISRQVKISNQEIEAFLNSPESRVLEESLYRPLHIRVPYGNAVGAIVTERQKQNALTTANKIINALKIANPNLPSVMEEAQKGYNIELQGVDVGYRTAQELPTDIGTHIKSLKVGEVSKPLFTEQGIDIVKLMDKKDNNQQIIDQWQTRHILISPSNNLSSDMAKQQIYALYRQLQQGADFATLASTYSKDGSASNGGLLGWVSEGEMVPEFEAMMKNTETQDFSIPFQTQFGWHILKVDAKRKQDVTDIYRKNMAREILYQRLAPQAVEDWLQEMRNQSYIKILEN